ncbi:MAG TPA: ribosome-associated translation inhibitor RaiA [Candidatus Pacearchaeota archaeon]|nr:ribosome-associated translation inhibitor RaiA [Candidatus Pacearchaeota archaeon]
MEIAIKTKDIELTTELRKFIEKKISPLEKFLKFLYNKNKNYLQEKPEIKLFLEIGKTTKHHKKGEVFFAEGQLEFPGGILYSTSTAKDIKLAIIETREELERQIKKYKEKYKSKIEKDRKIKEKIKEAEI